MKAKIIDFLLTVLTIVVLLILLMRAIEKENDIQHARLEKFFKQENKEISLCQTQLYD